MHIRDLPHEAEGNTPRGAGQVAHAETENPMQNQPHRVIRLFSCYLACPRLEILRNLGDVLARQAELFQQLARGTGVAEYVVDADAAHGCGQLLAQH